MMSEQPITSRTPEQRFASLVNKPYDGPVPELLLYRLLNATEVELRERLSQKYPNSDLIELRLGYVLQEPAIDNQPENADNDANNNAPLYWVGWGRLAGYENLLETGEEISEAQLAIYDDRQTEAELSIPLDDLIARLTEEMISQTPPKLLRGKVLKAFLITFVTAQKVNNVIEEPPTPISKQASGALLPCNCSWSTVTGKYTKRRKNGICGGACS